MQQSQLDKMENITAKALGKNLPISTRQAIEICSFIRGKTTDETKNILTKVINKEVAIPFKRFNKNVGHKKGKIAAGRYPKKASLHILRLVKQIEANAQNKGLLTPLTIRQIIANKASTPLHYGRKSRTKMKRTHIEIVVEEAQKKEKQKIKKND